MSAKVTPKNPIWRSILRGLVVNTGTTIVLWLCLELFFGLFMDGRTSVQSKIQFVTMTSRDFIVADSDRGFRLLENYHSSTVTTNSQGFRGQELPRVLSDKRLVLALGESTTFGWAVADDESYPSHLETILNASSADKNFVVVNAGVPSYSSRQVLLYAEQLLTRFQPEVVLVNTLWNDLFYSALEDWSPPYLVPRYPSALQATLYQYSRVYRWMASRPAKREMLDHYCQESLVEYRKNIASIIGLCKSKGVAVVFVEPPFSEPWIEATGVALWENRFSREFVPKLAEMFLQEQLEETEAQQVSFVRHPCGISERPGAEEFFDFVHTNGEGNRAIAQRIATHLHENELLAPPK
jgi:lysophospholipase L1-like esterase